MFYSTCDNVFLLNLVQYQFVGTTDNIFFKKYLFWPTHEVMELDDKGKDEYIS